MDTIKNKIILECTDKSRSMAKPLAIVLGSTVNALSYARSLGKNMVPVIAFDMNDGVVSKSKFCRFISVKPAKDSSSWQGDMIKMLDLINENVDKAIIFATSDDWQLFLVENINRWNKIKTLAPSSRTLGAIIDKQQQYELADSLGILVPKFKNALSVANDLASWEDFPAIIKPRLAHLGRAALGGKVLLCKDQDSLEQALETVRVKADLNDYLVQSVIGGGDAQLFGYLGFWNEKSQEVAYVVKQKLRQNPPDFGDGSYQITVSEPKIVEISRKLLSGFEYCGLVGIEYKKDPLTGDIQLIEINPRTVSGNQIAISAGVDFPLLAYDYLNSSNGMEANQPKTGNYKINIKYVHEIWDFWSFKILRKRGQCRALPWITSVLRSDCYALWSARDPYPFVWSILNLIRK